jgi:hypothetical protein
MSTPPFWKQTRTSPVVKLVIVPAQTPLEATPVIKAINPSFLLSIKFYLFISREYFLLALWLIRGDILLVLRPARLQIQDTRLQFDDGFIQRLPTPFLLRIRGKFPLRRRIPTHKGRARNRNVTCWRIHYAPTIPLIWAIYADVADYSEW